MASDPFLGARLKVVRARKHLDELQFEMDAWLAGDPYRIAVEPDIESGDQVVRFRLRKPGGGIPIRLSLIMGDVIHNLRSALDYVAWELGERGSGANAKTQFPIFDDPYQYRRKQGEYLVGVGVGDRAIIESLQPYHGWTYLDAGGAPGLSNPFSTNLYLTLLSRLDNLDKHRLLLPGVPLAPFTKKHDFAGVATATVVHPETEWVRMEDGAELLRLRDVTFRPGFAQMQMKSNPTFGIVFGNLELDPAVLRADRTTGGMSRSDARIAANAVENVISRF